MEKNLIKKLSEKLADLRFAIGHSKLAKRLSALALAGALSLPVLLTATACKETLTPGGTVNVNPNGGNQQGNQQGSNNQQGNQQGSTTPDIKNYSQILQTVLTSSYYAPLMKNTTGQTTLSSQQRHQHPLGFLKQEGYDFEDYFSRKYELESDVYIKGNDTSKLYIATRVESEHEQGNYYTCYVLQYELTKQEYADLKMLHEGNYVQAPFFIQELSYQKQPVSVNKASISKESYEDVQQSIKNNYNVFKNGSFVLDFLGYDTNASENYSFTFTVRSAASNSSTMIDNNGELKYLTCRVPMEFGSPKLYGDNVYNSIPSGIVDKELYAKSQPITYFESDYFTTNKFTLK